MSLEVGAWTCSFDYVSISSNWPSQRYLRSFDVSRRYYPDVLNRGLAESISLCCRYFRRPGCFSRAATPQRRRHGFLARRLHAAGDRHTVDESDRCCAAVDFVCRTVFVFMASSFFQQRVGDLCLCASGPPKRCADDVSYCAVFRLGHSWSNPGGGTVSDNHSSALWSRRMGPFIPGFVLNRSNVS